jgi:hypothetical protein
MSPRFVLDEVLLILCVKNIIAFVTISKQDFHFRQFLFRSMDFVVIVWGRIKELHVMLSQILVPAVDVDRGGPPSRPTVKILRRDNGICEWTARVAE